MTANMTKNDRVEAALKGDDVDRVPVSAWWHDYVREWSAADLAETTLEAYREYDWDFVKVNPRFCYYAEPWGTDYTRYSDRMPEPKTIAVQDASGLPKIKAVDGTAGAFAEQLESLELIASGLDGEAPFVQTVFSPLAVLSRITGSTPAVQQMIREAPEALEEALGAITETIGVYAEACLDAGASGIFYAAVEWGSSEFISGADYDRFGRPFDGKILEAVAEAMKPYARRGVHVNVDFYAGVVYYLHGIPADLFVPIFAMGRVPGWVAQVLEQFEHNILIRPLLRYEGPAERPYVPIGER